MIPAWGPKTLFLASFGSQAKFAQTFVLCVSWIGKFKQVGGNEKILNPKILATGLSKPRQVGSDGKSLIS